MLTRILAATVAGAVVMFLYGGLVWGWLLRSYFDGTMSATAKSVMNTEPSFVPLIVAQFIFAALFAFIFDRWASIRTFAAGLKGGAILMCALSLGWDIEMTAFFKDMHVGSPYVPIAVDVIVATVMGAIAGGVIGLVLGKMNKEASN